MGKFNIDYLIVLALFRVALEFLPIPWDKLPATQLLGLNIHRIGFYLALGIIALHIPGILLGTT